MTAPLAVLVILVGFGLLLKGADLLVDGAVVVARRLAVSDMVIGLTVVAFGTSAPELAVNLIAAVRGTTDIAIGNVIGSNIANILLILGVAASIRTLRVNAEIVWREIPMCLLAVVVMAVLANDRALDGGPTDVLTRIDGLVLLALFGVFIYYTVAGAMRVGRLGEAAPRGDLGTGRALVYISVGLFGLMAGGQLIVSGAVSLARLLGVSEAVIGLSVVAVGTSLPELATSIIAARRGNADIAVGNVVGSNIFNVLFILGISAVIQPLPFGTATNLDIGTAVLATLLLFVFMFTVRRHAIDRLEAAMFIALYAAYMATLAVGAR